MDGQKKREWRESVEKKLRKQTGGIEVKAGFTDTLDTSAFLGMELYFDMLNNVYIIL